MIHIRQSFSSSAATIERIPATPQKNFPKNASTVLHLEPAVTAA
jgi:hypothetical protein